MDFLSILSFIGRLLIALCGFGFIVCVHEFGHFIFARLFGVQVNEFAIGMGPKIFSFRANIPKKMRKQLEKEGRQEAFMAERAAFLEAEKKSKKKRVKLFAAANEEEEEEAKPPFYGTVWSLRLLPLGGFCAMEGEEEESENPNSFTKKAVWKRMIIALGGCAMNLLLGFIILFCLNIGSATLGSNTIAVFDEAAVSNQAGGLMKDDKILSVNGAAVFVSDDIVYNMLRDQDGKVDFVVERQGEKVTLEQVPFYTENRDGLNYIRIDFKVYGQRNNFFLTVREAALQTVCYVRQVIYTLFDLITGRVSMKALSGPVGVIGAVTQTVSLDMRPFFALIALLTVNIGVFNLFPIPPLDGNLFAFLALEGVLRRPVSEKIRGVVQVIGILLVLALFVFVTYSDIVRLVTG